MSILVRYFVYFFYYVFSKDECIIESNGIIFNNQCIELKIYKKPCYDSP